MTYTPNNTSGELPIEQFVANVTDAVQSGKQNIAYFIEKYALDPEEAAQFVQMIRLLTAALVPVKPNKEFTNQLKHDLIGEPERSLVARLTQLPPRVQIAAIAALGAGLWLLARRRYAALVDEVEGDGSAEIAAAR